MRAERPLRRLEPGPVPRPELRHALGVERVVELVARDLVLADDDQVHVLVAVVEKAVGDSRPRWESHCIACLERVKRAIDPHIRLAAIDEDELLLKFFGMRERCATAGRRHFVLDPDMGEAVPPSDWVIEPAHVGKAAMIDRPEAVADVHDERGSG